MKKGKKNSVSPSVNMSHQKVSSCVEIRNLKKFSLVVFVPLSTDQLMNFRTVSSGHFY